MACLETPCSYGISIMKEGFKNLIYLFIYLKVKARANYYWDLNNNRRLWRGL
jgi:hypothetical protein